MTHEMATTSYVRYSLRRQYVDEFHFRHVPLIPLGSTVLDLGGNRIRKRGQFDIEKYDLKTFYLNISTAKNPDVRATASCIPFRKESFDAVVCSELLEHVPDPISVISEVRRVLKSGGTLLICVPFLYPIHGDPDDFGRYTGSYWTDGLSRNGFRDITIERQGTFWSVLADMLRDWLLFQSGQRSLPRPARYALIGTSRLIRHVAMRYDARNVVTDDNFYGKYTTGFGIVAVKG